MPILIAHRGNLEGPSHHENKPGYIRKALSFAVDIHAEVDVWRSEGDLFLGHNGPTYKIADDFLVNARLWCHAKNLDALEYMLKNPLIHCFWHQTDDFTITSRGFIWAYPGQPLTDISICVKPEDVNQVPNYVAGICTDYVSCFIGNKYI